MAASISDLRESYSLKKLSENKVNPDPIVQFEKWWKQALKSKLYEPNAMVLATASADGVPSARVVLLKGFSSTGFTFYTNYDSYKGRQLNDNPKACLVFFWKELQRQVRITGLVEKLDEYTSEDYFHSRPRGSQIGAVVSPQSQVINDRELLESKYRTLKRELKNKEVERPANWGGYLVKPVIIEFWQGRENRLHDRIQYSLQEDGSWKIERLAP